MSKLVWGLLSFILLLGACSSSKQHPKQASPSPEVGPSQVPPGHVQLVGTIIRILDMRTGQEGDPCASYPCQAVVRVDSVLAYGSGVQGILSSGDEVVMHFTFTLAPTREARPDIEVALPGLKEGDRFRAIVTVQEQMGTRQPRFIVHEYEKVSS